MMRFVFGVVLSLATILGALFLEGGNGVSLLGISAFTMVWFVPFFSSAAVWGYRNWAKAWGAAFHSVEPAVALRSVQLWRFNEFVFYLAGFLGFLVGMILILGFTPWEGTTPDRVGRSLSAALISPLYGFFFGYMARILRARVEATNP